MKKTIRRIVLLLTAIALFTIMPFTAFAGKYEAKVSEETTYTTYLDDGSYYVETFTYSPEAIEMSSVSLQAATSSSKSASKSVTYYSSDNVALWKASVNGTFTYNGTTSTCTKASHSVTIYNSAWYKYSGSAYASGNKATANITMKKKFLGIVTSTRSATLTLTCDKNGNLS